MSAKMFQSFVQQVKESINLHVGIMEPSGIMIASTDAGVAECAASHISRVMEDPDSAVFLEGFIYQKVYIRNRLEYVAFVMGEDPSLEPCLKLLSMNITNIRTFYDERFDRNGFVKSILSDSIMHGDIALRAKELHIPNNVSRVAFLVKSEKNRDVDDYEIIQSLFPNRSRDFVLAMDDACTVLVKEVRDDDLKDLEKTAYAILNTLNTESMVKAAVGIGTVAESLADVRRSYRDAQTALVVGSIFEKEKSVFFYNSLGIGRLIYQLPVNLCQLFMQEVFINGAFEALDPETMLTIQKFFENDLNLSETARQLYVHRNTLVYRLDKIQKLSGLDLRKFDDAIIFKVAMMVKRYLDQDIKNG